MKNILLLLGFLMATQLVVAQTPNWSENVACIIFNNCSSCHTNGGIAPFSLLSYDDVKQYSGIIKEVVSTGQMPPWSPSSSYRPLADERLLSDEEIQTIIDWVDAGSPPGDLDLVPDPPSGNSNEHIAEPDLVIQLPTYTSKAVNGDEYRCFVVPTNILTDRFITGFEVIPGNRNMVHHVLIFQDNSDQPLINDNSDPDPGYLCFGGVGSNSAKMIGAWVPGQQTQFLPEGLGIKLPANSHIVVQLHYPEGSAGEQDNTKINFQLSDQTGLRQLNVDFVLNHFTSMVNGPLFIPANTVKTFQQAFKISIPVTIIGTAPHMHLIGRSIRSWAEKPDGTVVPLIDIPKWDFEWQGFYRFQEPVSLPAGSILKSEAVYDNTSANPHNPNDPPKAVSVGEATTDEMMLVSFTWMPYRDGDETLSLKTETPANTYDCNAISTATSETLINNSALQVFPNPVDAQMQVSLENNWQGKLQLSLYNTLGQLIKTQSLEKNDQQERWIINTKDFSKGVYHLSISNGKQTLIRRLVKQ